MSIIKKQSSTSSTAADVSAGETPMLTPEEVLEQVRALRGQIPDFVHLPNDRVTRSMRRKAKLNIEFAREAFGAVGISETVQAALGNTSADLIRAEDEMTRWAIVESELSALLRGVAAGNVVRRERIARAALQAYNVSTQLVKQEDHSDLLPHVERMKRLPKFLSGRRAKPQAEAPAAPQPPQPKPA